MVKIATVCMAADPRDKVVNRNNMIAYIEKAAEQGVDLIDSYRRRHGGHAAVQ